MCACSVCVFACMCMRVCGVYVPVCACVPVHTCVCVHVHTCVSVRVVVCAVGALYSGFWEAFGKIVNIPVSVTMCETITNA